MTPLRAAAGKCLAACTCSASPRSRAAPCGHAVQRSHKGGRSGGLVCPVAVEQCGDQVYVSIG